jgi:hypothetical protein
LGCQADFGHEHEYLAALGQGRFHGSEVDLGFSGAGDSLKKEGLEAVKRGGDGGDGVGLSRVEGEGGT